MSPWYVCMRLFLNTNFGFPGPCPLAAGTPWLCVTMESTLSGTVHITFLFGFLRDSMSNVFHLRRGDFGRLGLGDQAGRLAPTKVRPKHYMFVWCSHC